MRSGRWLDGGLLVLFGGFLLIFGVWLALSPQKSFSEEERRALTVLGEPDSEELWDGSYFREVGRACSDQFPLRRRWIQLKAIWERITLRGENRGILFGKDGYLIPRGEYDSLLVAEKNLRALEMTAQNTQTPLYVAFVPRGVDALTEYLPEGFDPTRSRRIWCEIEQAELPEVDLLTPLCQAEGEIYYRTDHHWTTEGAYLGYRAICRAMGVVPFEESDFSKTEVSTSFRGTSDATSGGIAPRSDRITLWRYEGDGDFLVEGETGALSLEGFYDFSALDRKDQYEIFLGGNRGRMTIRSQTEEREKLLLVKDSFSNALIPFLARYYDLDVIDPRYYEGGIGSLLSEENYDKILILWGVDTLATDPSLARFLET